MVVVGRVRGVNSLCALWFCCCGCVVVVEDIYFNDQISVSIISSVVG